MMPVVLAAREHRQDRIETFPLAIDHVAKVHAERKVAPVEMLHRLTQPRDRLPVKPRCRRLNVGILRIGHEADLERGFRGAACDEWRTSHRCGGFEKSTTIHGEGLAWLRAPVGENFRRVHSLALAATSEKSG